MDYQFDADSGSEMIDERCRADNLVQIGDFGHPGLHNREPGVGEEVSQVFTGTGRQIVDNRHRFPVRQEAGDEMRANETGTTGHYHGCVHARLRWIDEANSQSGIDSTGEVEVEIQTVAIVSFCRIQTKSGGSGSKTGMEAGQNRHFRAVFTASWGCQWWPENREQTDAT